MMLGYSRIDLSKGKVMSNRLSYSLIVLITIATVSACSNNNSNNKTKKTTVIHRVNAESPAVKEEKQIYAILLEQLDKEALVTTPKVITKPKVIKKTKKKVQRRVVKAIPLVTKKTIVKRHSKNGYKTPSYKAPIHNIRYAALSGDYANNQQTHSFINKMISKHGFDRGYLNYLLSNTKATPFLKRMAYRDAFGSREIKKNKKPR